MRVTNLILHIITMIVMLPDLLYVAINTLMSLGYLDGMELLIVPGIALIFGAAFVGSTAGEIKLFASYRSIKPKTYMRWELLIHGLCAVAFGIMIAREVSMMINPPPRIPELSTRSDPHISVIDVIGFSLALVGIIINLISGKIRSKKAEV